MPAGFFAVFHARPLRRRILLALDLLALYLLAGTAGAQPPGGGLDLRETVAGVLAYTRWPQQQPHPLRLCILGESPHAERLLDEGLPDIGQPLVLRRLAHEHGLAAHCDALYLGSQALPPWRQLQPELAGQPVLTLCERSEACTAGGMVRLDVDAAGRQVRFEVNLDAVARGTVRIHPQVLRLGRRGAAQEGRP